MKTGAPATWGERPFPRFRCGLYLPSYSGQPGVTVQEQDCVATWVGAANGVTDTNPRS